jgi:hypothetical protein
MILTLLDVQQLKFTQSNLVNMNITFGSQIIQSYKRLSYTAWFALAEFVDNSTEAYLANKNELDHYLGLEHLTVKIIYSAEDETIIISDNSIGMDKIDLDNALNIGKVPKNPGGRSRYGLGMKTAACWLGNLWSIKTKKLNSKEEHTVTIDVERVAANDLQVDHEIVGNQPLEAHYTIITIKNLNRSLGGRTAGKVDNYLRSMYRKDFESYGLELYWQEKQLDWDYNKMIYDRVHRNRAGEMTKRSFSFQIGEGENVKTVQGWAAVFVEGSRKHAGFSIIQNNRVIQGWPDSYRPYSIFGDSRNDLVNQRLVGEIFLDEFAVSHTKDEILFLNNEQDELEAELLNQIADLKSFAEEYRKYLDDERVPSGLESGKALNEFEVELNSSYLRRKIEDNIVPESSLLRATNRTLIDAVMRRMPASLKATIGQLEILIYIDLSLSPNDPYVLLESTVSKERVVVVINAAHPHWLYLKGKSDVLNFIRHCTYDGVAEWKANFIVGKLDNDTIKHIKDGLLRVPFEIESSD